jgi:hypothetical protein
MRRFDIPDGAHEAWNAIDLQIADAQSDQVTVAIADRIWSRVVVEPDQAGIDLLASHHGADVVPLDYVADREGGRRTINDWVAERTEGLIPELLPEDFIRSNTVLVLTDALYFAADWERPFGKYGSVDGRGAMGIRGARLRRSMGPLAPSGRRNYSTGRCPLRATPVHAVRGRCG